MQYTTNFSLKKPQYADEADIEIINDNSDDIDNLIHQNRTMIAPAFDSTKAYVVGDPVVYLGELFVFIADKAAGAWDATKVEPTTAAEMGGGGASALADLDDVEITSPTDGQALLYDDSDDKWKNGTLPDPSVTKEASGNPIEITDAASAPLVKCVTAITGSQNLHGYDKPWVGGAGKNKLPTTVDLIKSRNTTGTWSGNSYSLYGVTFKIETDGDGNVNGLTISGTATNEAQVSISDFTFKDGTSYKITGGASTSISGLSMGANGFGTWAVNNERSIDRTGSGDFGSFIYFRVTSGTVISNAITVKPMIRLSTVSDPTFVPYSNICPITAYSTGTIEVKDEAENTDTYTATFPAEIFKGSADYVNSTAKTEWGMIASYAGETLPGEWISDRDVYAPGTTPTTGAQVAYELATPTTAPVAVSNTPIKSLSGYTHIESSTGEMEVEYISGNYQVLVDLIQSSSHVYSTAEQVVGKWTDGKDIYEKTFILETEITLSANRWNSITGVSLSGVETPIDAEIRGSRGTSAANVDFFDSPVSVWGTSGTEKVKSITFRYTKSTSNRSLNAPVNTQKAQIEPLSEKEEEVPTEEEKAVETPETEEPENER